MSQFIKDDIVQQLIDEDHEVDGRITRHGFTVSIKSLFCS